MSTKESNMGEDTCRKEAVSEVGSILGGGCSTRPTLLQELKEKRQRLEQRLRALNCAIALLEHDSSLEHVHEIISKAKYA